MDLVPLIIILSRDIVLMKGWEKREKKSRSWTLQLQKKTVNTEAHTETHKMQSCWNDDISLVPLLCQLKCVNRLPVFRELELSLHPRMQRQQNSSTLRLDHSAHFLTLFTTILKMTDIYIYNFIILFLFWCIYHKEL